MAKLDYNNLPCYYNRCDTSRQLLDQGADDAQLTESCAHLALVGLGLRLDIRDECPIDRVNEVLQPTSSDSTVTAK